MNSFVLLSEYLEKFRKISILRFISKNWLDFVCHCNLLRLDRRSLLRTFKEFRNLARSSFFQLFFSQYRTYFN